MYTMYITLLLSLSTIKYIGLVSGEDKESSSSQPTSTLLPLIMIKHKDGDFTIPKSMAGYNYDKDGFLIKGTVFQPDTRIVQGDQVFFCGPDETNGGNDMMKYLSGTDQYCTFLTDLEDSELLRCTNEPQPFIRKVVVYHPPTGVDVDLACGPADKEGVMYAFQYKICPTSPISPKKKSNGLKLANRINIEAYRFCYSQKENQVLYTEHIIKSPSLLSDVRLFKDQGQTFPMMTEGYHCSKVDFQKILQIYDEMEKQNEVENMFVEKFNKPRIGKSQIHAQKLVPHEDLVFALWRKATYHAVNLKPMREDAIKLWEYINQVIRDDAVQSNKEYKIFSGTFKTPEGKHDEPTGYPVQITDIWIKIIHYRLPISTNHLTETFTIVVNNNLDRKSMDAVFDRICAVNLCKDGFAEKFAELGDNVRCCSPTPNILDFFNVKFSSDVPFMIESFKSKKNRPSSSVSGSKSE